MSISSEHDPITGKVFYSNEGWMILSWVFVFISSILASFIITKIQYKIWERFIGRFIYKIKPYSILYFVIALAFIIGHIMNCLY